MENSFIKQNDGNFFVQIDKYNKRAKSFLLMGGTAMAATLGLTIAAPALGALAVPAIALGLATGGASVLGFGANKVAAKMTDVYEPQTKREKISDFIGSLRDKAFASDKSENKFKN